MIKRENKKEDIMEFIKECIIILVFSLSVFWIVITGVYLTPKIVNSPGPILTPFFYSLGTLAFSIIVMYVELKYVGLLGSDEGSNKTDWRR